MRHFVDLHVHSNYSDGVHPPARLIQMADELKLAAIAIADHDTVDGVDEALEAALDREIEVIPAVELSTEYGPYRDIHILGYYLDHHDPQLRKKLSDFRTMRDDRGKAITDRVNRRLARERKAPLAYADVLQLAEGSIGRPHIGRILIKHGYARDMEDAFRRYLIPCNVPKKYFAAIEAIDEIRRVGGVAVLAHPATISESRQELHRVIGELAAHGLDGLEVYNNKSTAEDSLELERLATDLGLLRSGGSDFHGFEDDLEIGTGRGKLAVKNDVVEQLRKRATSRIQPPLSVGGGG
ncbi:phosphatase [Geotalea uraniireducens]|uniref:Phosphatase n=1 Tax=Geotalea uraniireducens TaxID=351604 RepID=A0ABM8EKW6_9BACT|nr:PHP domain-containing protein [Geotalea uraniireducens]BDV43088.1 phosphatase [Geotalea uraniireducens]